jgi:microcin C transport system substrate-binding protein
MGKILVYILAVVLCLAPMHAEAEIYYGLAMNGTAKYSSGFSHFDYVNPEAPKGGTLHQAATGTFDSLNPYALKGTPAQGLGYVYDHLMARSQDEPFTMYPMIAEKVDVPDDRSSITFFLNPKAKFQDGTPITADDVIFSFTTLRDQGRANMRNVYKLVKIAEKLDGLTVKFSLGSGFNRETVMILSLMPILPKAWWQGKVFDASTLTIPVGSGPYKIASVDAPHRITYERDKNYWATDLPANKGLYNFDRIIFDYYRDDTVALEAFKSGQLNFRREFNAAKWSNAYNIPAIATGDIVKEVIPHHRTERINALVFNTRRAQFEDSRVREAIGLALDFKWLNDNLFYGLYKQVNSFFPNSYLAATGTPDTAELKILEPFRSSIPPEVFGPVWQLPASGSAEATRDNLRKADELLKEAGWVVKDGARIDPKTGKALSFELLLGEQQDAKLALALTRNLKRLGIDVNVRVLDISNFQRRLNSYDFDMMLSFWNQSLSPGTEQLLYWGCEAAKQQYRMNYAGICTPAIDAISGAIANAKDRDDLVAHAHALDRLLLWGHYIIPLYYPGVDFVAHNKALQRPETVPLYGMVMESWWENSQIEH